MTTEDSSATGMPDDNFDSSQNVILPSELLDRIPEEEREAFSRKLVSFGIQITREERYSSTLLPYKEAAGWDELVPGSAERIFSRYEQLEITKLESNNRVLSIAQDKFRKDNELAKQRHDDSVSVTKLIIINNSEKVRRGQWIGLIGAMMLFAGGIHLVNLGESLFGVGVFLFEIVAFAGVYVNETRRNQNATLTSERHRNEIPHESAQLNEDS